MKTPSTKQTCGPHELIVFRSDSTPRQVNRRTLNSVLLNIIGAWCAATSLAAAPLVEIAPDSGSGPASVFGGQKSRVAVALRNSGDEAVEFECRLRVFQASSTTAVLLLDGSWKELQIPARETIVDSAALDFPSVRAETKFLVQWIEGTNHILGTTEVWVYPTNLLHELRPLFGEDNLLGVFDPQNELKPALRGAGVRFEDLGETVLDSFRGRLAIIGPFASTRQVSEGLGTRIKALANRGVLVVWMVPPPENCDTIMPSFYTVLKGASCVVVVQRDLVKDFSINPQSQLNFIHFCKLALQRRSLPLPYFTREP